MKECNVCHVKKDDSLFYKNKETKDGLSRKCIECQHSYFKDYYQKNSETIKERTGKRRDENKKFLRNIVIEHLKTHPCVDCGENDIVVLEFDHIRDKIKDISSMCSGNSPVDKLILEMKKCEVRCANCHKRKTAKDFGWYKAAINNIK